MALQIFSSELVTDICLNTIVWAGVIGASEYVDRHPEWIFTMRIAIMAIILIIIIYVICIDRERVYHEKVMQGCDDIMKNFHKDPNYDDFMQVYKHRHLLLKESNKTSKFWFWGVYIAHPEYYDNTDEIAPWLDDIGDILEEIDTEIDAEKIDCVWALYFATGDRKYANIIRNVTTGDSLVHRAARMSYQDIIGDDEDRH